MNADLARRNGPKTVRQLEAAPTAVDAASQFTTFWQTVAAAIVAGAVMASVTLLMGALFLLSARLFTEPTRQIIDFVATIAGVGAGVALARAGCDSLLNHYAKRPIFGMFAIWAIQFLLVALFPIFSYPELGNGKDIVNWQEIASWHTIPIVARSVVLVIAAYYYFWRGAQTGFRLRNPC